MPLPAYLTEQPSISPLDAVAKRIRGLGHPASMTRRGRTIVVNGIETAYGGHDGAQRAIRIACEYADAQRLTIETAVPAVSADVVSDFEASGFRIVMEVGEDEDEGFGAHYLLRRSAA